MLDIQSEYYHHRKAGKSRAEAISTITQAHTESLLDLEDGLCVMVGLCLALMNKKELTCEIAHETSLRIRQAKEADILKDNEISEIEALLLEPTFYGDEAHYPVRKKYAPDWKVGDAFSHPLTHPMANSLGIFGWSVVMYKVGEYQDSFGYTIQLVYTLLCPPEKTPAEVLQMPNPGFLKMMQHGDRWDYLAQLRITSQKAEKSYQLDKIGTFSGVALPLNRTEENPLLAMPFTGSKSNRSGCPEYEELVCRLYRKFSGR